MKFGRELDSVKVDAWSFYYLDYDGLKKNISRKATTTVEGQQREQVFAAELEKEVQKINSFATLKSSEILHGLKSVNRKIKQQAEVENDEDANSTWFEDACTKLEEITQEFIKFDEYKNINVRALIKLLKKHDKHQKNQLRGFWEIRLQQEPFVTNHTEITDKVIIKLSKCWFMAKQLHNQEKVEETGGNQGPKTAQGQVFERSTTKYWVPMDKVLFVKTEVLKHLPVSSFNKKHSALVTSVYYDNDNLDLYHERLKRDEGSIVIRMRTYNEPPQSTVFVERKVHHESWITEKSVKSRFPIKEKNLMKYLRGELSMKDKLDKMLANKAISESEYNSTLELATQIQESVLTRKLQPTMTTRYERTAFQLEGNAKVRVSLDCSFDLITEHGYRNGKWGRDLTNEAAIPDNEIHHFPHAILEIKLSFAMGEQAPVWVQNLLAKDYIIAPGKFSKYIHGCAVNIPRKVTLLPNWFPMLEQTSDFRADDRILMMKNRDGSVYGNSIYNGHNRSQANFPNITQKGSKVMIDLPTLDENGKSPKKRTGKEGNREPVELVTMDKNGKAHLDKNSDSGRKRDFMTRVPIIGGFFVDKKQGKKKKVQAPLKIEPKTFFANERTFLQWMSFLVLTVTIGTSLLSLSSLTADSRLSRIVGLIFCCISIVFMFYAIIIFLLRRAKIARREKGPYDERFGPIAIVVILIAAVIAVIVLHYGNFLLICKGSPLLQYDFFRYNPSDLAYNPNTDQLITVGPDMLTYIDVDSHKTTNYAVAGDLEAVTYVPNRPGKIYIGNEFPPRIIEWDETTKIITRRINLDMSAAVVDEGLEGLTFVPIEGHPHGGLFWAGCQADGKIYIYDVDFDATGTGSTLQDSFQPLTGLNWLAALTWHPEDSLVYGIVGRRWIFAMDPYTRDIKGTWAVGVGNPEGIVVLGSGPTYTMYIACDACFEIWKFKFTWSKGIHSGHCGGNPSDILASDNANNATIIESARSMAYY